MGFARLSLNLENRKHVVGGKLKMDIFLKSIFENKYSFAILMRECFNHRQFGQYLFVPILQLYITRMSSYCCFLLLTEAYIE